MQSRTLFKSVFFMTAIVFALAIGLGLSAGIATAQDNGCEDDAEFTSDFLLEACKFTTQGSNPYFILKPGYRLVLEDEEGALLNITVLSQTKKINLKNLGLGKVRTRIVEEREWDDEGNLIEVSKNYFAVCRQTNAVYYFGEDVDICEDGLEKTRHGYRCNGEEPSHEGAWLAGQPSEDVEVPAMPGLIMPGTFLLFSKYYQEIAPGVALDRAENVEMGVEAETEAGDFEGCVSVEETTSLDCEEEPSEKMYCPGIGLVVDDEFELVAYGRDKRHHHHDDDDDDDD
jgi:hypothetical protein